MVAVEHETLLDIKDLDVTYRLRGGLRARALRDVGFSVGRGSIVGLVGESGCGKSTLGLTLLGLLPPNGLITRGSIVWRGRDLTRAGGGEMRAIRGREIAMCFQDPYTTLNPAFSIGTQLFDLQRAHSTGSSRRHFRRRAVEVLAEVGIPDADHRASMYPHQFSGGMRQRIALAGALLLEPALLIADEPTSALDVTLEGQILELLRDLRERRGTAILLVSHDLGVIAETCDHVVVMYAGKIVEMADVGTLFSRPGHPYTNALLAATPSADARGVELASIPGLVPSLASIPDGCPFAERCPLARAVCARTDPVLRRTDGREVACHALDPESGYDASGSVAAA